MQFRTIRLFYKLILCVPVLFLLLTVSHGSCQAESESEVSYLEFSTPYTITDTTPLSLFSKFLLSGKLSEEGDFVPDQICSCEYITACAKKSALDEYGLFILTKSPSALKTHLTSTCGFSTLESADHAVEGDIVYFSNCPGVVVDNQKVLFVDSDYRLFFLPLKELEDAVVIHVIYPTYETISYIYMKDVLGYSTECAVGVLSNLYYESVFEPDREERSNQMGFGICQWSKDRRLDLEYYALDQGRNLLSLFTQLDFMDYELNHRSEFNDLNVTLRKKLTADEDGAYIAAFVFCQTFENPDDAVNAAIDRGALALMSYYPLYGGI